MQASDLRARLAQRVPGWVVAGEESLRRALQPLALATGLPIVVDERAEQAVFEAGVVLELNLSHPIRVDQALDLLVELAAEDVAWTLRHGTVLVTTRARARGATLLVGHDIRPLTRGITDFRAPRIGTLRPDEDEEYEGPVAGRHSGFEPEEILELVRENVAPESWGDAGVSAEVHGGLLVVRHSRGVQREIRRLLEALAGT